MSAEYERKVGAIKTFEQVSFIARPTYSEGELNFDYPFRINVTPEVQGVIDSSSGIFEEGFSDEQFLGNSIKALRWTVGNSGDFTDTRILDPNTLTAGVVRSGVINLAKRGAVSLDFAKKFRSMRDMSSSNPDWGKHSYRVDYETAKLLTEVEEATGLEDFETLTAYGIVLYSKYLEEIAKGNIVAGYNISSHTYNEFPEELVPESVGHATFDTSQFPAYKAKFLDAFVVPMPDLRDSLT